MTEESEINIKESTKETKIKRIIHLLKFIDNKKSFYEVNCKEILFITSKIKVYTAYIIMQLLTMY